MKVGMMAVALVLSLVSRPALAENQNILRWTTPVIRASSPRSNQTQVDQRSMAKDVMSYDHGVPDSFRLPLVTDKNGQRKQRLYIKVTCSSSTASSISATEITDSIEGKIRSNATFNANRHNLTVMKSGTPSEGDYLLEVKFRALSGKDQNRNYGSNSQSDSWRGNTQSSSLSGSDSREWTGVYIDFQSTTLSKKCEKDSWEVVVDLNSRISGSDSEITATSDDSSSSRSESYSYRGRASATHRAEQSGSEQRNDEGIALAKMTDDIVSTKCRQAVNLVFIDWSYSVQGDHVNEMIDQRVATSPTVPQRDAVPQRDTDAPLEYSVKQ